MSIQVVINQAGPLPITAPFNAPSDAPMYLEVCGSVWSQNVNNMLGIAIQLDGQNVGTAKIYSNGSTTHRTVVPAYILIQLGNTPHTLTLSASGGAVSDSNDVFTAVIHY